MAITNDDVKLFESQRLTDEENDGGWVGVKSFFLNRIKIQDLTPVSSPARYSWL